MPKIKILSAGYVSALRMYAPIVNPVIVPASAIGSMLREKHRVIEYNDKGKGVLLTLENYRDPHRFDEPKKEEPKVEKPVENPYGNDVSIDTDVAVFSGYTKNTSMITDMEPPKASTSAEVESSAKLTRAQRKALAKAKREEEAAKATAESTVATTETPAEEVAETSTEVIE